MVPKEQKALFLDSKHGNFVVRDHTVPTPGAGEILTKVRASGLNPIDWKIQRYGVFVESYPIVLGIDIAGDVTEVGEGVVEFSAGDRVVAHGVFSNTAGGFQQYVLGIATCASKLPSNISYDQAATFPSALGAAYLSLYNHAPHGLGFASPTDASARGKYTGIPLLIFGGATVVGQYAIQLAKFSGFSPIIVTASLKHSNRLKEYGADKVIDRHVTFDVLREEVTSATSRPIEYILDAVSMPETQQLANDILTPGGYLQIVQPPKASFSPDKYIGFTKGIREYPENQQAFERLYGNLFDLLEKELCPVEVIPGGLAGVPSGIKRLENNQVSGTKLVGHPQDTD